MHGIGFESAHYRSITWTMLLQQPSEWQGSCFGLPDAVDRYRKVGFDPHPPGGRKGDSRPLQAPGTYWEYNDGRINQLSPARLRRCLGRAARRPRPAGAARGERAAVDGLSEGATACRWGPDRAGAYSRMAIPHAQPGQPIDVGPLGSRLPQDKTVALFKSDQLEVIRLVLAAGKSLPPHKVPGEITIHCLEGRLAVGAEGVQHALAAGQLLYLRGGVMHDVTALQDAAALVTIVLRSA